MHWIRRHCRLGSWAALLALTIQLVLSFGHIHAEDILAAPASVAAQQQAQPDTPSGDAGGTGRHHDLCAICIALNLTRSSVVPVVELPAVPVAHPHGWDADIRRTHIACAVHSHFQARAPPSV